MPLTTYEDFMELSVKQLSDYLSVRGLSTSGKKVELIARAFAAMELRLDIIESTESQKLKLQAQYDNKLSELEIPDPKLIAKSKRIDDLTKWPYITLGNIFSYILKKRDFDADYIGKYKDQKAFSYFNSGFVGQIYVYELSSKKDIIFAYCDVRASQSIHENKDLWIVFRKKSKTNTDILTAWCSCMARCFTRQVIMLLRHCIKLNMQIIRDGGHHLVLRLHVSGISPPKSILNQRELLSYLYTKVSGQNKRTLVKQVEKKQE